MRDLLTSLAAHAVEALGSLRISNRNVPLDVVAVVPGLRTQYGAQVNPDSLLKPGRRALVVGGAGQGKTILLQYCAVLGARRFLARKRTPVPLYVSGAAVPAVPGDLLSELAYLVTQRLGSPVDEGQLASLMGQGRLALLVDGVDEAGTRARELERGVTKLGAVFPRLGIVASTRPTSTAAFDEFETLLLSEFSDAHIRQLIERIVAADAGAEPTDATSFLEAINLNGRLLALARNPLLLQVLWQVYRSRGSLPATRSDLYADATDYLLSTLRRRLPVVPQDSVSLAQWHRTLQGIALSMLLGDQQYIDKIHLHSLIEGLLTSQGLPAADPDHIIQGLEAAWLLVPNTPTSLQFAHRSFQEYFAARAVAGDPASLANLDEDRGLEGLLGVLREWLPDWRPLLEAAVRAGRWRTVARLISEGPAERGAAEFLVDAFEREFGAAFLELLRGSRGHTQQSPEPGSKNRDVHAELLRLWADFSAPGLEGHEKGARFERFAESLFGQVFNVVERDMRTWRGELDFLLEIRDLSVYWIQFGGDVLVECKNWASRRPVKEVSAFFGKVDQSRVKLAFFVSVSGFTKDAVETLRLRAANPTCALVVPLSGEQVVAMLRSGEDFGEFFKGRIRAMQHQQKL